MILKCKRLFITLSLVLANFCIYLNAQDTTPPSVPGTPIDDGEYTTSSTNLHFRWTASSDNESGIAKYLLSIGDKSGGTNILTDFDVGNNNEYTVTITSLTIGQNYYAKVKAINGDGLSSTFSGNSDGIFPALIGRKSKLTIYTGTMASPPIGPLSTQFIESSKPGMIELFEWAIPSASSVKQKSPNTIIIGRKYISSQNMSGNAVTRANEWWNTFKSEILSNSYVDYWVGYNEPPIANATQMKWYADFEVERIRLMALSNKKTVIGSFGEFAPATPEEDSTIWPAFSTAIDAAITNNGILGLHEEACPLNDCFTGDILTGTGFGGGRYRKVSNDYLKPNNKNIKIAITAVCIETSGRCGGTSNGKVCGGCCGWRNSGYTWRDYRDQLLWYDNLISVNDYVMGAMIFALEFYGWDTYDIGDPDLMSWLNNYVGKNVPDATAPVISGVPQDDGENTTSTTALRFRWTAATDPETGISKYYLSIGSTPGGTNILNDQNVGNVTDYTATGLNLTSGTTYYAKIRAENSVGLISGYSNNSNGIWVYTAPVVDTTPPGTPSLISPTNNFSTTSTNLNFDWSDVTDTGGSGLSNYEFQVSTDINFGVINHTTTSSNSSSVISNLSSGTYYWRVRAKDKSNNTGNWSTSYKFTVLPNDPAPSTPQGLRVAGGNAQSNLVWTANTEPDLWGYSIYRRQGTSGPYTLVYTILTPGTTCQDIGLTNNIVYYYRISAIDTAKSESTLSTPVSVRPESIQDTISPAVVTDLKLIATAASKVKLRWTAPGDDGTYGTIINGKIRVEFSETPNFTPIHTINQTTSTLPQEIQETIILDLTPQTSYYFRLYTADEMDNWSTASSNIVSTVTLPTGSEADFGPPGIVHIPISRVGIIGDKLVVAVNVTDDSKIDTVRLYYRLSGTNNWNEVNFIPNSNGNKTYTGKKEINPPELVSPGIEYFITAGDAVYVTSSPVYRIPIEQITAKRILANQADSVIVTDGNPDDGTVRVDIPANTFTTDTDLVLEQKNINLAPVLDSTQMADLGLTVNNNGLPVSYFSLQPENINLTQPITITLLYFDFNPEDGIVDGTEVKEDTLHPFIYTSAGRWEKLEGKTDTTQNTVLFSPTQTGKLGLFSVESVSKLIGTKEKFITPESPVTFTVQTEKVVVYTLTGVKVTELDKNGSNNTTNGRIVWYGNDQTGTFVESGIYVYSAEDKEGKRSYGTLVIAK